MPRLLACLAALFAAAPIAAADPPAPPPAMARTFVVGWPDLDRLDWMRGWFDGANVAQKADWRAVDAWLKACFERGTAAQRDELKALGEAAPRLGDQAFPAPLCSAVVSLRPPDTARGDWEAFHAANAEAGRAQTLLEHGAKLGFEATPFDPAWVKPEALELLRAPVREQVYRNAMIGLDGAPDGFALSPATREALRRRLWAAATREDAKNTAMLKAHVAKRGWPSVSKVGARASHAAWLLVQHADADPTFQLRALRMMEPLTKSGDVSQANYAYLYDRVGLKLRGAQRYGTQVTCDAQGNRIAQTIEAGVDVAKARASMKLEPLADYLAMINRTQGRCPPRS